MSQILAKNLRPILLFELKLKVMIKITYLVKFVKMSVSCYAVKIDMLGFILEEEDEIYHHLCYNIYIYLKKKKSVI